MRPFGFRRPPPVRAEFYTEPDAMIHDVETMLRDLRAIRSGQGPTAAELARAPMLERWCFFEQCFLEGEVVLTSRAPPADFLRETVWVWNEEERWARVDRGYVRLGQPRHRPPEES